MRCHVTVIKFHAVVQEIINYDRASQKFVTFFIFKLHKVV